MVNRPFKNTKYKGSGGIKVGSMENWIQTPEPYRDVRGLRHGPVPEAPQPLAHGPPGLHPAVPAPQGRQGGRPTAASRKAGPRRQPGRAPRLTQQGAGQGAAAIAPRSSGPPSVSAAPTPRPPQPGPHPEPSPSASELPTAVDTRTQAQESDSQSSGCLFSGSLPAPHAGLHTAPHTPLRTALLRLAHASNERREPGRPIRIARGERGLARGRHRAGHAPPPRSASSAVLCAWPSRLELVSVAPSRVFRQFVPPSFAGLLPTPTDPLWPAVF
ncbi:hypothetical protein NN561_010593 [Cricetulus griseus]